MFVAIPDQLFLNCIAHLNGRPAGLVFPTLVKMNAIPLAPALPPTRHIPQELFDEIMGQLGQLPLQQAFATATELLAIARAAVDAVNAARHEEEHSPPKSLSRILPPEDEQPEELDDAATA